MNLQPVDVRPDLGGSSGLFLNSKKEMNVDPDLLTFLCVMKSLKTQLLMIQISHLDQAYESNDHPNDNIY